MTRNYLTLHILTALPMHNLNRDESGAPKQVFEGGVTRARLSAQSLKRAARIQFERTLEASERSNRSKCHATSIVDEVIERIGKVTDKRRADLTNDVTKRLASLVSNTKSTEETEGEDETKPKGKAAEEGLVWLSPAEREALVRLYAGETEDATLGAGDSLAIAAFGRMLAAARDLDVDAAVMVSPATTTHEASIELDYFTAVDDLKDSSGAGHLDYAMYTSGVYYRSVTIDRRQLLANYSGDPAAYRELLRALVLALPQGKRTSTAADTLPSLILAEQQSHRTAYSFQTPVEADAAGGFLAPSITALLDTARRARAFDPEQFGDTFQAGIDAPEADGGIAALTDWVSAWLAEG